MSRSNVHALFRSTVIVLALAGLAACSGPDPTKFSCSSSAECPSGYHCDLGTASSAGSLKCASGAPQQKTITADADKFVLAKHPSADGSTRTTILAEVGAVTSTPDFVGVHVIASQGGKDIAESSVLADGSVLEFQLPQATAQVALRVQDDSGHSVSVTGYRQQVELSFVGKDISGNTNPNTAYDVTASSDSLYPPATWIASGPGPGGTATELAVSDTLLPDGGIQSSASYSSIGYLDYHNAATSTPIQLQDPSGAFAGSNVGWQEFSQMPTAENPVGGPTARVGATMSNPNGIVLYGGTDLVGNLADPAGSFWQFDAFQGWTQFIPPAGANALPSGGAKAGVAIGYGGSTSCTAPCTAMNFQFSMAGGLSSATTPTSRVVAYGTRTNIPVTGTPTVTATGWFDVGTLPFANAGMANAPAVVPISNSTTTGSFESFAGMIMVGGSGVALGGGSPNGNDVNGCMVYAGYPFGSMSAPARSTFSCADSNFNTANGEIGFRTGVTLVQIDSQTFYLFGGNKTGGINPAFPNGFKNDLWKGVLSCDVIAPAATCTTHVTWTKVVPASGVVPPLRANAGGAVWQTTLIFNPTFTIKRRIAIYGGDAGANAFTDFWEYDVTDNVWRQVPLDGGSALTPAARTRFTMVGDGGHAYLFGGNVSGTVSDQMWLTTREGPARLLVKAPFSLPAVDQATASSITVDAPGYINGQAFLWDGTRWRYIGTSGFEGGGYHLLAAPSAPATGFLQPDGNIYLLLIGSGHASPSFDGAPLSTDSVKMTVDFK